MPTATAAAPALTPDQLELIEARQMMDRAFAYSPGGAPILQFKTHLVIPEWDTKLYAAGSTLTDRSEFFKNPIGSANADGFARKTLVHTSFASSGELDKNRAMTVIGFGIEVDVMGDFASDAGGEASFSDEAARLVRSYYEDSVLEVIVDQTQEHEGQLKDWHCGSGITGVSRMAGAIPQTWLHPHPTVRFTRLLSTPFPLRSGEPMEFYIWHNTNHTTLNAAIGDGLDLQVKVRLYGLEGRPVKR